jgi:hypothetical protein
MKPVKPKTSKRSVIQSGLIPKKGRPRAWAYGYADLAELLGTTEGAVRQLVYAGRLVPDDLRSIIRLYIEWNQDAVDRQLMDLNLKKIGKAVEKKHAKWQAETQEFLTGCPACGGSHNPCDCEQLADHMQYTSPHVHRWLHYHCEGCGAYQDHVYNPVYVATPDEKCFVCGEQLDSPYHIKGKASMDKGFVHAPHIPENFKPPLGMPKLAAHIDDAWAFHPEPQWQHPPAPFFPNGCPYCGWSDCSKECGYKDELTSSPHVFVSAGGWGTLTCICHKGWEDPIHKQCDPKEGHAKGCTCETCDAPYLDPGHDASCQCDACCNET